jgi:hypothetical protein
MMSGGEWKEGICEEDGLFYIYTKEWDAEAFLILMNVLHLRNRQVPRSVSLEMLTKIAVLVDFYECWEAVDMWGSTWANGIKYSEPVPLTYGRELIMWICVARVFGLVAEFKQATQTAIKQSHESIQISGLPIYPNIVGKYNFRTD